MLASRAGRSAAVQLPMGQIATLGLGCFAIMNPDKFLVAVSQTIRALNGAGLDLSTGTAGSNSQPIIIQQGPVGGSGLTGSLSSLRNLLIGAGLCWGSYMVLINVLPDYFKELLPVSTARFNTAVKLLGKSLVDLKDSLTEEVLRLGKKQDELSQQQEETHEQVVDINGKVTLLGDDITLMQETLKICEATLMEQERRSIHTARGVKLLTQSVSTFLPEDDNLLHELNTYNNTSVQLNKEKKRPTRIINKPSFEQESRASVLTTEEQRIRSQAEQMIQAAGARSSSPTKSESSYSSVDPESEIPDRSITPTSTKSKVEHSVEDVRNLLRQYGVSVQ